MFAPVTANFLSGTQSGTRFLVTDYYQSYRILNVKGYQPDWANFPLLHLHCGRICTWCLTMLLKFVLFSLLVSVITADQCLEEINSLKTKFKDFENKAAKYERALTELMAKYDNR